MLNIMAHIRKQNPNTALGLLSTRFDTFMILCIDVD